MMRMVAREADPVVCLKHALGTIGRVDREVLVNGTTIAAVGDAIDCGAVVKPELVVPAYDAPNRLMAGASEVLVGGRCVVGIGHATQHNSAPPGAPNGLVLLGSGDVFVGGNTAVGNVADAVAACEAANRSRRFKGVSRPQSYDNCGCESMRQLINGKKGPHDPGYLTEDEFLNKQAAAGNAQVPLNPQQNAEMKKRCQNCANDVTRIASEPVDDGSAQAAEHQKRLAAAQQALDECYGRYRAEVARTSRKDRLASGGTNTKERNDMGNSSGVPTHNGSPSIASMAEDIAQGKGVVVPTEGLPDKNGRLGPHIVIVAGVILNDAGEPVEVIYNDSVAGCNQRMGAAAFGQKVQPNAATNVTKDPVW